MATIRTQHMFRANLVSLHAQMGTGCWTFGALELDLLDVTMGDISRNSRVISWL